MRQRSHAPSSGGISPRSNTNSGPSHPPTTSNTYDSSDSDPEDGIQTSPPPSTEDNGNESRAFQSLQLQSNQQQQSQQPRHFHNQLTNLLQCTIPNNIRGILHALASGGNTTNLWWVPLVTIYVAATLTYSYYNNATTTLSMDTGVNVQVSIMTIIVLVGATPFCSTHLTTAAIGAFVGGQNILGAVGLESPTADRPPPFLSYVWLLVLSLSVTLVWCFVIDKFNILNGYAGRLGTTTFLGMNLAFLTVFGPLGVIDWSRYYFGFLHLIHVAEETEAPPKLATAWTWTEEAELAIGYVGAVVWLSVAGGGLRIWHDKHIQQWHRRNNELQQQQHHEQEQSQEQQEGEQLIQTNSPSQQRQRQQNKKKEPPPTPLNNILVPCIIALISMLLINLTSYTYAPGLFNGFAVGSYVAMASLAKLPTVYDFAVAGALSAGWGLALTPVFVGFAGKSGFTSMLGHVTYDQLIQPWLQQRRRRQQREQLQAEEQQQERERQQRERQEQREQEESQQRQQQQQSETSKQPSSPVTTTRRKPAISIEEVNYTKQQRRQQQRLIQRQLREHQHQQQQQQQQQQDAREKEQRAQQIREEAAEARRLLHHRAWSAAPQGDRWEHPKLQEDENSGREMV